MKRFLPSVLICTVVAGFACRTAHGAEDAFDFGRSVDAASSEDEYAYEAAPARGQQPSIAHQKAMARAEQRMARLASMKWYGFSGARPTATGMAFTTMYSPAWQSPGGRPFAWHAASRPIVIYRR
ncbi:MAG: hypothetical protein KF688_02400 [Pirellulales bacterium]|nr:hypothetical protein [Pirellulales bacterium]